MRDSEELLAETKARARSELEAWDSFRLSLRAVDLLLRFELQDEPVVPSITSADQKPTGDVGRLMVLLCGRILGGVVGRFRGFIAQNATAVPTKASDRFVGLPKTVRDTHNIAHFAQ
ncbi:hypothetical protein STA1M1_08990 [Sinisalibacter aestuarii]|uniref:Uncharacterized protein n=1 Tax=Sinisalibacter aestuarii TaxID=2949426 RepID=A0ABQ5LPV7_9RHOB|nr:hypothetical protein STA1M1_08990 [Sinisalibacter aestuarii]